MNLKVILLACIALGLVIVPLVAAAPRMAQNGDTLQTLDQIQDQQQLHTRDCIATCTSGTATVEDTLHTQDRLRTQEQQQLQTRDCANTCVGNEAVSPDPLQTQERLQTQTQTQQRLQTRDCKGTCNGDCNEVHIQIQTLLQESANSQATTASSSADQNDYAYSYQHQLRNRNQAP
jgi:hypothetical protein